MKRDPKFGNSWEKLGRFLVEEIDSYPINEGLKGNNLEEDYVLAWFADARQVRDLNLEEADKLFPWVFIGDVSGNEGIFYPMCLALLKQALIEPEKRLEEQWRLTCAVGYVSPGFDHESRWRTLMTSGLFILLLKMEHVADVADGLCEALLDIVGGVKL